MKLHRRLAQELISLGVDPLFGLIGDGNLWLVDSFVRDLSGTYVSATHEANAVLMASGYARLTGNVGVVTTTHGPAVTNTLTALTDASRGRIPLVMICGDTPVDQRDHSQNVDHRSFIVPTGAGFEQVRTAATALEDLRTAFRRAVAEERPIVLNVPREAFLDDVEDSPPLRSARPPATAADPDSLDRALGIIATARRPVVLAGRGAIDAAPELVALADQIGAALATTLQARGLFTDHDFDLGVCGTLSHDVAVETISNSDCLISFGASLNQLTTDHGGLIDGKAVVQCDSRPDALNRFVVADAVLLGDAALTARRITEALVDNDVEGRGWRSDVLRQRLARSSDPHRTHDPDSTDLEVRAAIAELSLAMSDTKAFVTDLGRFVVDAWRAVDVLDPRSYVHANNFGSIGLGMSYAIGMTFGTPEPVLLVSGDGGFMLGGLLELTTAARYRRDLVVVVVNDGAYGAEHVQFRQRGLDPSVTVFDWPDLADLARAAGVQACTVRTREDLAGAVAMITDRRGPVLVDLIVPPEAVRVHD